MDTWRAPWGGSLRELLPAEDTWRSPWRGAPSKLFYPPRKWHQWSLHLTVTWTACPTIGGPLIKELPQKSYFRRRRQTLGEPHEGALSKNLFRRRTLGDPHEGALSENFQPPKKALANHPLQSSLKGLSNDCRAPWRHEGASFRKLLHDTYEGVVPGIFISLSNRLSLNTNILFSAFPSVSGFDPEKNSLLPCPRSTLISMKRPNS